MNTCLSVVMPLYNGERFIAATLESARGQCVEGIEFVAVDDGSTDRTREIVSEFARTLPIRLIAGDRIGNWVGASNVGLREARGEWACFLQQDDLWLPGRIARLWREMQASDCALIIHDAVFIGPDGRNLGPWTCPLPEGVVPREQFLERLLVQNFIAIPSPIFRRKLAVESGGMDESLWVCADWDLWLRLGELGPVRFIAESLSAFRVHSSSQAAARKLVGNEWEQQLLTVVGRHLSKWGQAGPRRQMVERAAGASAAVNSTLAAWSRGEAFRLLPTLVRLITLGPLGLRQYLRDSRIAQRVGSRVRLKLTH